jgi:hypothetical protein
LDGGSNFQKGGHLPKLGGPLLLVQCRHWEASNFIKMMTVRWRRVLWMKLGGITFCKFCSKPDGGLRGQKERREFLA